MIEGRIKRDANLFVRIQKVNKAFVDALAKSLPSDTACVIDSILNELRTGGKAEVPKVKNKPAKKAAKKKSARNKAKRK